MAIKSDACLEVMITIVDSSLEHKLSDYFKKLHPPIHFLTHGIGMAQSEVYEILGFGSPKKAISISVQPRPLSNQILNTLHNKIEFNKPGTGITFTIPIGSASSYITQICSKIKMDHTLEQEEIIMSAHPYNLIITIVNKGSFDQVMEAANSAGATGGTLLHGRGLATEEAVKFLGITIQPEKDIILILAPRESHHKIMESISHEVGINTPGKGICFSLPVNSALGLGTLIEE